MTLLVRPTLEYASQPRPRELFPGFGGGAGKAREKGPGDEVD